MAERPRLPVSTYRLQFNRDFTFADAAALVPYCHRLGVSHCYASPYLRARPGSAHGYDIVDHTAFNPEIGDRGSFDGWADALQAHGMGHILDLVPNHMGVGGSDNHWWLDVLENGPASAYAVFFDIDWRPHKEVLRGKVLLPVLGDHYGRILETGELKLAFDAERGEFSVWYWEHRFPVDPATYPQILELNLPAFLERHGTDDAATQDLQAMISAFGHMPARWDQSEEKLLERRRDKEVHKRHLAELCQRSPAVAGFIERAVDTLNGDTAQPASFGLLHRLLEQQAYRLAYWRVASDEINYRRFFDINDLAGLRTEEPAVFDQTHRLVLQLIGEGRVDGLRIDHPDGLYDPVGYYYRLVTEGRRAQGLPEQDKRLPFYFVVEKILANYEHLPPTWPVHGTTGYDFAAMVGGLFVFADTEHELDRLYGRFTGVRQPFEELLFDCKKLVIETQLSSELTVLTNMLDHIAQLNRNTRDFTLNGLRDALTLVVAAFPVYRTYINARRPVSDEDHRYVEWAIGRAKKLSPAADTSIFDFIRELLVGEGVAALNEEMERHAVAFAMKLQQYTAPVMAKGMEDTAFYIYNRLVSLNEVGGDPRRFAVTVSAFHHVCQERQQRWPHAMLTTSTHDTKRSEDVRARVSVLSELPGDWQRNVGRWARLNRAKKVIVDGEPAPSRNDEYLLYQTLVGAWPLDRLDGGDLSEFRDRIRDYMLKAVREAKVHTSWVNTNADYEEAVAQFVDQLMSGSGNRFLTDFLPFARRVARLGLFNALSQLLLKLAAPGVPDIYQGNELWEFALVDPDNRRPVDYARREALLGEIERGWNDGDRTDFAQALLEHLEDGRIKLFVTWRLLQLRRRLGDLFTTGEYLPLTSDGRFGDYLCAFARRDGEHTVIALAPRWFGRLLIDTHLPLGPVWEDTQITLPEPGQWHNLLTGETIDTADTALLADLLGTFPIGLFSQTRLD